MVSLRFSTGMPAFKTEDFAEAIGGAYGDLSLKRNLGLLIGHLAGWKALLFLDDDIFGLSPRKVRRAVGSLRHFAAVGMPATQFPDNSVVCHARRRFAGDTQDVFVSGSALAVDVEMPTSFFPAVYNEDWMFLAPHLDKRSVTFGHPSRQRPYYPFDSPDRAVRQEFGDVVAEGLIGHLHTGDLAKPPSRRDWATFLARRADVIEAGLRGCEANWHNPMARDAMEALLHAQKALSAIKAAELVAYVRAWQADLDTWRDHTGRKASVGGLKQALDALGLRLLALTTDGAPRRRGLKDAPLLDAAAAEVSSSG